MVFLCALLFLGRYEYYSFLLTKNRFASLIDMKIQSSLKIKLPAFWLPLSKLDIYSFKAHVFMII